jgi:hypothetical protein
MSSLDDVVLFQDGRIRELLAENAAMRENERALSSNNIELIAFNQRLKAERDPTAVEEPQEDDKKAKRDKS